MHFYRGRLYGRGPSGEGECTVGTEGRVYKGTEGTLGRNHTVNRRPSGSVAGSRRFAHPAGPLGALLL